MTGTAKISIQPSLLRQLLLMPDSFLLESFHYNEQTRLWEVTVSGDNVPDVQGALVKATLTRFIPDDPHKPIQLVWSFDEIDPKSNGGN